MATSLPKNKLKKHETTTELVESLENVTIEENLTEVLNTAKVLDNTCANRGCKTKVGLFGDQCRHCSQKFCFKHNLPEVHGCGEAVKKTERENFCRPVPHKVVQKKEDLEKTRKRLQTKLKDMNSTRKSKPPKDKKG